MAVQTSILDATNLHARLDELLAAHRLWSEWLATGRVRKLALVTERAEG